MEYLFDKLKENGESDIYPYHMPGHKRQECGRLPQDMYLRDITEIDGFDNLHQPEGVLLALQKKAAELYGAEESFYLINGSTGGILSAISAALPVGGHILMSRNCHKSAYHGAYLRNLTISYLYPRVLEEYDIFDAVTPGQVQDALEAEPDIGAVLLVSPTYEGRISDIREIAQIVHEKGIPLIVDEAHGAHLGWADGFAENSCRAGADLVIHSVHKTLPALTQTALLHVNGRLIDREQLKRFLHIYQSSSPSYLLMASIDNALNYVSGEKPRLFADFLKNWRAMLEKLSACRHLCFPMGEPQTQDVGKLVISVKHTNVSGRWLYDILLEKYHLQMEMAAESYVLAMFTMNDTKEGYERLTQALLEIDGQLSDDEKKTQAETFPWKPDERAIPLAQAWDMGKLSVELAESIGSCAGEFVNLYPPGVPVLVPGEHITKETCESICRWLEQGLTVQGVEIQEEKICVKVLRGIGDK
ncbi:MAG: aminotransferase class I/II-fold pyridoxal phosphate-dependent enzyme [Acetatifactor sp.]